MIGYVAQQFLKFHMSASVHKSAHQGLRTTVS